MARSLDAPATRSSPADLYAWNFKQFFFIAAEVAQHLDEVDRVIEFPFKLQEQTVYNCCGNVKSHFPSRPFYNGCHGCGWPVFQGSRLGNQSIRRKTISRGRPEMAGLSAELAWRTAETRRQWPRIGALPATCGASGP